MQIQRDLANETDTVSRQHELNPKIFPRKHTEYYGFFAVEQLIRSKEKPVLRLMTKFSVFTSVII